MRIGFMGLGQMGRRMVRRLSADDTWVWNRTRTVEDHLAEDGYGSVDDVMSAVAQSDVVFTMLRDQEAVREVGRQGLFAGLRPNVTWVDLSTGSPEAAESFHALAVSQGAAFVAAPVLGTLGPAAQGTLTVLAGGAPDDVARVRLLLDRFGTVHHLGGVKDALVGKLMVNAVLAYYMEAVSEMMALADREGLPRQVVVDILQSSSVAAPVLRGKAERFIEGRYDQPDFPIDLLAKDLDLIVAEADRAGVDLPGVTAMRGLARTVAASTVYGRWDMAGVGEALAHPRA